WHEIPRSVALRRCVARCWRSLTRESLTRRTRPTGHHSWSWARVRRRGRAPTPTLLLLCRRDMALCKTRPLLALPHPLALLEIEGDAYGLIFEYFMGSSRHPPCRKAGSTAPISVPTLHCSMRVVALDGCATASMSRGQLLAYE